MKRIICNATEQFNEYVYEDTPEGGILRNVLLMGFRSDMYTHDAIRNAAPMFEKTKCYMDHSDVDYYARNPKDELGFFSNVRFDETTGVRGDLYLNGTEACNIIKLNAKYNVSGGFSSVIITQDAELIDTIYAVLSVDYVANPRCSATIYNSEDKMPEENEVIVDDKQSIIDDLKAELEAVKRENTELQRRLEIDEYLAVNRVRNDTLPSILKNVDKNLWDKVIEPYLPPKDEKPAATVAPQVPQVETTAKYNNFKLETVCEELGIT